MVKDAQSHAADDRARREVIDARNQADSLAYQVEKTLNEYRGQMPSGDVATVEAAIAQARSAAQGDNLSDIRSATEQLQRASHTLAERLNGSAERSPRGAHSSSGADVKDGEVVDAEYAEASK